MRCTLQSECWKVFSMYTGSHKTGSHTKKGINITVYTLALYEQQQKRRIIIWSSLKIRGALWAGERSFLLDRPHWTPWMIMHLRPEASAARFRAEAPWGWAWPAVGEEPFFLLDASSRHLCNKSPIFQCLEPVDRLWFPLPLVTSFHYLRNSCYSVWPKDEGSWHSENALATRNLWPTWARWV